ncbi:UDP-galactopyranose mutase [Prochlorococcus marinus str. MIT 9201]|uniref:UDP-galactopyranose mutase n=1 Tax=Prochlorococcus marinus str. MIT 9201 TaxID=93057 RepID=A0A0A2A483_PROMR|nr:UDP-galactopyranose mutase [Prochlorococcus marinus]KGF96687.1 UDP-galactopyranose mutase [Prochlorococcus marinus str. MIT 9201]
MTLPSKKVLIAGAGLAGSTIARVLAENNVKVEILEKRNHIAGNIYDYINSNNERIHKYGPHLLHCNVSSKGLAFLSRFTHWINYEHRVRALLKDGRTTPLPINKITLQDIYGITFKNEDEVKNFLNKIRNKSLCPKNTDQFFEANVGNKLANIFFRPYTKKMWGLDPKQLEISIGARLPIRTNDDTRYFNDNFQALPKDGYSKMIERMLDHKNINVNLNTSYHKGLEFQYDHAFLCIPIDEFYQFKYGKLPYRSIIFRNILKDSYEQPAPVINFTDDSIYTRKTQWNLFPNSPGRINNLNTITFEKPCSIEENPGEYYYPIKTRNSKIIYENYRRLSQSQDKITFCGRTGLFKYIDMIPAVNIHLKLANDFLKGLE